MCVRIQLMEDIPDTTVYDTLVSSTNELHDLHDITEIIVESSFIQHDPYPSREQTHTLSYCLALLFMYFAIDRVTQ